MIESVLAMLNLGFVVTILGTVIYISFAKAWIHFSLYEALYCLAEDNPRPKCQIQALNQIQQIIPLPKNSRLQLEKHYPELRAQLRTSLYNYDLKLTNPAQNYRDVK